MNCNHRNESPGIVAEVLDFGGGDDGTRTRDLWLDRPVC